MQLSLPDDPVVDPFNNFELFARRSHVGFWWVDRVLSKYQLFVHKNLQTHAKLILRKYHSFSNAGSGDWLYMLGTSD